MNILSKVYYTTSLTDIAEKGAEELLGSEALYIQYSPYFGYGDIYSFMIGYMRKYAPKNEDRIIEMMNTLGIFPNFAFDEEKETLRKLVSLFLEDAEARDALKNTVKNALLTTPNLKNSLEKIAHYNGIQELKMDGFLSEKEKYIILDMPTETLRNTRWYHAGTVSSMDDILQILTIMSGHDHMQDCEITLGREGVDTPWLTAIVKVIKHTREGNTEKESSTYRFIPMKWARKALEDSYNRQMFKLLSIPTDM